MPDVTFAEHSGKRILIIDLSNGNGGEDIVQTAGKAMQMVRSSGEPRSVRGLIDLSGTHLNRPVRESMLNMSRNNGPYMKYVAFVGLRPGLSVIFRGLLYVTGRKNHRVFRTREEAMDWLAEN